MVPILSPTLERGYCLCTQVGTCRFAPTHAVHERFYKGSRGHYGQSAIRTNLGVHESKRAVSGMLIRDVVRLRHVGSAHKFPPHILRACKKEECVLKKE